MSPFAWLCTIFITYWVIVLLWIKGTEPLASDFWAVLWKIIKIPLYICTGFFIIALFYGGPED